MLSDPSNTGGLSTDSAQEQAYYLLKVIVNTTKVLGSVEPLKILF